MTPVSTAVRVAPGAFAAAETVLELLRALAGFGDLGHGLIRLTGFGATSGSHVIEGVRRVVAAQLPAGQP